MGAPQFARQIAANQGQGVGQEPTGEIQSSQTIQAAESVEFINADQTTTVSAGTGETTVVKAPAGYIYELRGARLSVDAPGGSAGNNHVLSVSSESEGVSHLFMKSDEATKLLYSHGYVRSANDTVHPTTEIAQLLSLRGLQMDDTNGLQFDYNNNADVDQTNNRVIRLAVRKYKVA